MATRALKEKLTDQLNGEQRAFPGVSFNFSQYISDNVEEALSGVKGENSVKVYGESLDTNEKVADRIVQVMGHVEGVQDLGHFKSMGQPNIRITPRRETCARYGLNTGDVDAVVQAAVGGQAVTQVYEGEKHFEKPHGALEARIPEQPGGHPREITVTTPDGAQVPLGQLADIQVVEGPAIIYREDGVRYSPVKFSVRGRDLANTIADAQAQIDRNIPPCDTGERQWRPVPPVRHAPRVGGRDQRAARGGGGSGSSSR